MNYLASNIWYPYFSLSDGIPPIHIKSASGVRLTLANGRELVDGISSWWAMCHGYSHPYIIEQIKKQLEVLPHVMFGGIVHDKALELSSKLIQFLKTKELTKVFYSDSGSTAVEVGIKMAIQYFFETGEKAKNKIIYFEDGYHGETLGALSFSHSTHSLFPSLDNKILLKIPTTEEEFKEFEIFLQNNSHIIAGAIMEPLMQGAGGMKFFSLQNIKQLWMLLKKYKVLIIADECATGFYRLGSRFAFFEIGIEPDILVLGKALTGGHLPLALTVAKEFIFKGICGKSRFFHGPTFMANPVALASAIASIELFEKEDYKAKVVKIETIFKRELPFENARIKGAVCAFDIAKEVNLKVKEYVACGQSKSFLRPFGTTLYATPPLIIEEEDLKIIIADLKCFLPK
jgi:adenosylmethionine-8-amino-7-oxononanoate aminotransferase